MAYVTLATFKRFPEPAKAVSFILVFPFLVNLSMNHSVFFFSNKMTNVTLILIGQCEEKMVLTAGREPQYVTSPGYDDDRMYQGYEIIINVLYIIN